MRVESSITSISWIRKLAVARDMDLEPEGLEELGEGRRREDQAR